MAKPAHPKSWPRLTDTLPHERHPCVCQSCGADSRLGAQLSRWQEHDEDDAPEPRVVVLCPPCEARLIEPHPRLYRRLHQWAPMPGSMPICAACPSRDGVRCAHPDLKANGGPGLALTYPTPTHYFWDGRAGPKGGRRTGGMGVMYHGPVSKCAGRPGDATPTATDEPKGGGPC